MLGAVQGSLQIRTKGKAPQSVGSTKIDDVASIVAVIPLDDGIAEDFSPVSIAIGRPDSITVVGIASADVEIFHTSKTGKYTERRSISLVIKPNIKAFHVYVGTKVQLERKIIVMRGNMRYICPHSNRPPHKGGSKIFFSIPAIGSKLIEHVHKRSRQGHVKIISKHHFHVLVGTKPHICLNRAPYQGVIYILVVVGQIQPIFSLSTKIGHVDKAKGSVVQASKATGFFPCTLAIILKLVDTFGTELVVHLVGLGKSHTPHPHHKKTGNYPK